MNNGDNRSYRYLSLVSIAGALLLPIAWWLIKDLAQISDRYLPSASAVAGAINDLDPSLLVHSGATITRLLVGFVGGTVFGIGIGILFSRYVYMDKFFSPSVHALRAVPAVATVPFFLLWFGFSETGRYLLVFLAVGLNVAVASRQILTHHSRAHLTFFRSYSLSPGSMPLKYSLPRVLEEILPTLRYSLSVAIGAVIVAELLGAQIGLARILHEWGRQFPLNLL